jgi:hypothetical protein
MMEQVDDSGELVERVAALDIGKASVMACTRIPHEDGRRRLQEVREYGTTTGALLGLAGQLRDRGGHPGGDGGDQRYLGRFPGRPSRLVREVLGGRRVCHGRVIRWLYVTACDSC